MAPIICDLYARVSTIEQATEGYSLDEQEARLRAYAAAQGWTVNAFYADRGISGAKLDRPGIQAVIADAKAHIINKVVTYKLDRLSRSQRDTLYLIEDVFLANGVDYVSMTEAFDSGTNIGRAILGVLSTFAQLERSQIAERMMMGRVASAKEGNWRGGSGVPIGYRYLPKSGTEEGRLVVDPYEAAIVRKAFALFLSGKTFNAIHSYLREHYTTSYGGFGGGAAIIPSMLSNRVYIGEIKYCGQWYQGKHTPILDEETFQRAQDKLVEYRATLDDHRRKPFEAGHLLTGLLFCGECGARWCYHCCSYTTKAGERRTYGTYTCYTKNAHKGQRRADRCSIPVWSSDELEGVVWDQIGRLRFEPLAPSQDADAIELESYKARISEIEKQLAKLIDLYAIGGLPFDKIEEKAAALNAEKETLRQQCDILRRRSTRLSAAELADALAVVEAVRDGDDEDAKRELVRLLIRRITLGKDREVVIEWNI